MSYLCVHFLLYLFFCFCVAKPLYRGGCSTAATGFAVQKNKKKYINSNYNRNYAFVMMTSRLMKRIHWKFAENWWQFREISHPEYVSDLCSEMNSTVQQESSLIIRFFPPLCEDIVDTWKSHFDVIYRSSCRSIYRVNCRSSCRRVTGGHGHVEKIRFSNLSAIDNLYKKNQNLIFQISCFELFFSNSI